MKLKLVIFFVLFFQLSRSQIDSTRYYYQNGNYNKAILYGEKLKKDNSIPKTNLGILLNHLALSYSKIGDIKKAEINYLQELEIEKSLFGENHAIIANTYRNLGNLKFSDKEFIKSENYFLKAIEIKKNIDGIEHPEYSKFLLDLAVLYKENKNYKKAEEVYTYVCELTKKYQGVNSQIYNSALISFAIYFDEIGNHKKTDQLLLESYTNLKNNIDKSTISAYFFVVDILGMRFGNQQKFKESQEFYSESLELKKQYFGESSKEYTKSLINLGISYSQQSDYSKSRFFFEKVLSINKNLNSDNINNYTIALQGLITGYSFEGKYDLSELYLQELIKINKIFFGEKSLEYIKSLVLLAENYLNKGDLNNAEIFFLQSITEIEKINSSDQLNILNRIVDFYLELNNNDKAYYYLTKADALYQSMKSSYDKNDISHYMIFRSWCSYYLAIGDLNNALDSALKRIQLIRQNPLFDSLKYAYSKDLSDLGLIYKYRVDYVNSEKNYLLAYEIRKDKIGQNPRNDASLLLSIGLMYQQKNDFNNAEKYFVKAIELADKIDGELSFYDDLMYYTFSFYNQFSLSEKAMEYLLRAHEREKNVLEKITSFFSVTEIQNYIFVNKKQGAITYSYVQNHPNQYPSLNSAIYENQLLLKNLSLRNQQRIKATIEKNGDTNLKEKYQRFLDNKRYITKIEELPAAQKPATYDQLKAETESLEKEITRLSSTFAEAKKSLSVTWKQIQEKLKPNDVVIDLVSFNYYNNKWTDSTMYGAFVIKKDSKFPKFVSLFEEKQLAVLLERNNKAHDSIQSKIINKQYSDKEISDLFYKPLEAELKNSNTIYLAPSGLAHQINFKALPVNTNQTLGEKYKLILLGTTTTLVDYKPLTINKKDNFEIVLYGGINYNKKQVEVYKEAYPNELNDLATRSGILEFNYLPGTNDEVNKINKEAIMYNFKTTIKTESAATEESVKQLSGKANPFILHLATHGFFFENTKQELSDLDKNIPVEAKKRIYLASEDPMMRSGLLLAGANNSWRKTNNETNADDGILTAKEIANLDLSNCKLVVLSACETGLGQINGSEGVFGLQRAFKMAGVQNIIMSLWKVPDAQTSELFENFYAACFSGKSIQEAFSEAQNKMKEKYSPYYWAGFVLLE